MPKTQQSVPKTFSFAFLAATVLCLGVVILNSYVLVVLRQNNRVVYEQFYQMLIGYLVGFLFVATFIRPPKKTDFSRLRRLQTLVHELKHAAVIVLTGNILTGISVHRSREAASASGSPNQRGEARHRLFRSKRMHRPVIALAPYYFPLFSLPVLIVGYFVARTNPWFLWSLGCTLALDLGYALAEFLKPQMDFKRIVGGRFLSSFFLVGFHLAWLTFCVLTVISEQHGYLVCKEILLLEFEMNKLF